MDAGTGAEGFDIIHGLLKVRRLNEIAERILGSLGYEDLKHSDSSSPEWREAIDEGNLWKKLLHRQMDSSPSWKKAYQVLEQKSFPGIPPLDRDEPAFYRVVCHSIADSLKRLKENWANGSGADSSNSSKFGQFRTYDANRTLKMDEKWIVCLNPDFSFHLFNRWTQTLEKTIQEAKDPNRGITFIHCFDFDEDYLVAGYRNPGTVCVWRIATGELIHVLPAMERQPNEKVEVNIVRTFNGRRILAVQNYWGRHPDKVVIRKMPGAEVTHRMTGTTERNISDAHLDDDHLILLLTDKDLAVNAQLEIRSLESLDAILHSIELRTPLVEKFHYCSSTDGLVAIGSNNFASVWNVRTGQAVWNLPDNLYDDIITAKVVNGKYVVIGHSWDGQVTIFDIGDENGIKPPVRPSVGSSMDGHSKEMRLRGLGLLADDYQILSFGVLRPKSIGRLNRNQTSVHTSQQVLTVWDFF